MCPTEKVKSLKLQSNRFSIISEIITKLLHSDITYCEVPAFFHASSRKRKTVTLKNLYDTIVFCSTFCWNKNKLTKKIWKEKYLLKFNQRS